MDFRTMEASEAGINADCVFRVALVGRMSKVLGSSRADAQEKKVFVKLWIKNGRIELS